MFYEPYIHYTVTLVFLLLSVYIFAKRPQRPFNFTAALLHLSMAVFSFSFFILYHPDITLHYKHLFVHIGSIANFTFAFFAFWTILAFTGNHKWARNPYFISLILLVIGMQIYFQLAQELAQIRMEGNNKWRITYENSLMAYIHQAFFYSALVPTFILLFRYWRKTPNRLKAKQAFRIFLGGMATFLIALTNISLNQYYFDTYIPNLYDVILLIWAFTIVQAIYKQDIFDMVPQAIASKVFRILPAGLLIADGDNRIIVANKSFCRMSGREAKELLEKDLFEILSQHNVPILSAIQDIAHAEHLQTKMSPKKSKDLDILISHSLIENNGEKVGKIIVVKNISELKYFEGKIRNLNKNLESQVIKRTKNLLEAKEKAEESDRLKTFFLQNISHEIRTPINGIQGFSHLLNKKGISQAESAHYAEIISKSSAQLLTIVNDILTMASLQSGEIRVFEETGSLDRLIDKCTAPYLTELKSKGLGLTIHFQEEIKNAKIKTDIPKLEQIISKVVENAVKFTQGGEIRIECRAQDGQLHISVKDTGIGIPKERQQDIFESFRQVEEHISRKFGGTGLGLSIVKGYLGLMGGKIKILSEIDHGSEFFIQVPCTFVAAKDEKRAQNHETNIKKLEDKTILVAEDEEVNYLMIEELLQDSGAKLLHARNGQEAIASHEKEQPDLTLMDIKMPIMNGLEASREIINKNPNSLIIMQTAYDTEKEQEQAMSIGVKDFISKPFDKQKLIRIIMKHIS